MVSLANDGLSMRDRVVLFDMESFTDLEAISLEEENGWESLLAQFAADTEKCLQRLSIVALGPLYDDLDVARLTVLAEEKMSRNELLRVLELQRHGCSLALIHEAQSAHGSVMNLLHDPPPAPPDESWRHLPQLLSINTDPIDVHKPSYSAECLSVKLGEQLGLSFAKLQREEEQRRDAVCSDEQRSMRLIVRSFERERDGLLQIEQTIEADVRQLTLCRLPPEERQEYVLGPCRAKAAAIRTMEELVEDATRVLFTLGMESLIGGLRIKETSDASAVTVQAERTQRCLNRLQQLQWQTHGIDAFRRWQSGAIRFRKRRTVYPKALKLLRLRTVRSLLYRYCTNWFQNALQPLRLAAVHDLTSTVSMHHIHLHVSESEERDRVFSIIMEEVQEWDATLEMFFQGRDALLRVQREQQALMLSMQNDARRQLTILAVWFRFAHARRDQRRADFLFSQNQNRHRSRVLSRWQDALPLLRRFGPASRELRRGAVDTLQRATLLMLQQHGRLILQVEAERGLLQTSEQFQFELAALCEQAMVHRYEELERSTPLRHMALRWHTFLTWTVLRKQRVGVMYLSHRSTARLLLMRWSVWSQHARQSSQKKQQCTLAQRLAHERQLVEEESDLQRVRLEDSCDIVMRKLRGRALRSPDDLQRRSATLRASLQRQWFAPWRLLVRRTRQAQCQASTRGVDRLRTQSCRLLSQAYFQRWSGAVEQHKSADQISASEVSHRAQLCDEENVEWNQIADKHTRRLEQTQHALLQESQVVKETQMVFWKLWRRWAHRQRGQREVAQQAPIALCRRAWWLWLRSMRHRVAIERLATIRAVPDRALRLKYFRRLMPAAVRLMKVSKAKANLDRAQAAARVLQGRSFSAADDNRSPRTPTLPPLKR